jgi:hypothetical protein
VADVRTAISPYPFAFSSEPVGAGFASDVKYWVYPKTEIVMTTVAELTRVMDSWLHDFRA